MFWFVTHVDAKGEEACWRFNTVEALWKWLGEHRDEHAAYPKDLCVYKGECVFDGS